MREGARSDMAFALEKPLAPATGYPKQAHVVEINHPLDIAVMFTSVEPTLWALKQAGALADRLNSRITLVVPQIVPYPLPLTRPPVLLDFNERRFSVIASKCRVDTIVRICLCRDRWNGLATVLKPHSLVVIGGRKRWWPAAEARLARRLRRAGHEVITVEME